MRRDQYSIVETVGMEAGHDLQIIPEVIVTEDFSDTFLDLLRYIVKGLFLTIFFSFVLMSSIRLIFPGR